MKCEVCEQRLRANYRADHSCTEHLKFMMHDLEVEQKIKSEENIVLEQTIIELRE